MGQKPTTSKPFAEALYELLRDHDEYLSQTGNVNLAAFADALDLSYELLRKALAGDRNVTPHIIEECARVLRIDPSYFVEWRAFEALRQFDVNEVGYETVLANLERFASIQMEARRAKPGRRRKPRRA